MYLKSVMVWSSVNDSRGVTEALICTMFTNMLVCPRPPIGLLPAYLRGNETWPLQPSTKINSMPFHLDRPYTDRENDDRS
jgi:hypothetical protein